MSDTERIATLEAEARELREQLKRHDIALGALNSGMKALYSSLGALQNAVDLLNQKSAPPGAGRIMN